MDLDKIIIAGIVFYGYHGVTTAEQELGQKFLVDLELHLNLKPASISEHLTDTIDYKEVYDLVKGIEQKKKYRLIESLASDIAQAILDRTQAIEVLVRVKKPQVPIAGVVDYIAVEIRRRKNE
ncbi:MAG: dihydroneopterin aldolase [bacterium]|nr:dihydroneopterin aldolase [bacterium]